MRYRSTLYALCTTLCATSAHAQTLKPITHETMWAIKRVGAPALSPDGAWAVFSVTEPAYAAKDQVSDLWIVRTDGTTAPRRLTNTKGGEGGVAWSPDGKRIAFTARREGDEATQVYVLDMNGGEAQRVTSLATGARTPRWRPDGNAILFTSSVSPRNDKPKYNARVYESFPIRNWDHWLTDAQSHLFVQPLQSAATAKDILANTKLVASAGFAGVGNNSDDELDAAWSPDGSAIVFSAASDANRQAWGESALQLFRLGANGGEPQQLTTDTLANLHGAKFGPDGKLYALAEFGRGDIFHHTRLVVFESPNATSPRNLTGSFDRSVAEFQFSADGKTIYIQAEDQAHNRIFSMPISGGAVRALAPSSPGAYTGISSGGRTPSTVLVASWQAANRPPEIVRVDVANGTHRELTFFTRDAIANLDMAPMREFWFTAKNGRRIHNWIVTPANFDASKKYPLYVVMHGGPAGAWIDNWGTRWNYHLLASPGYVLLLTQYTGSTGFSEQFGQAIKGDPLKGPADEINQAADEAIRLFPFIDASRQAAGGGSYGGHLAYWMEASTTRYKALIAHAGAINPVSQWGTSDGIYHRELMFAGPVWEGGNVWREQSAALYATKYKTPILLTVGEKDFRVPLNNTLEAWSLMQRMRVPSKLLVFPDENHWILDGENSRFWYSEVHSWLGKYLKP